MCNPNREQHQFQSIMCCPKNRWNGIVDRYQTPAGTVLSYPRQVEGFVNVTSIKGV
ncbi:hypothetical protein MKW92_044813 [Papaver armeniacum]|nr:hypothetical protein MKW92_044813 [Papaver armeniacum]